MSKVLIVGVDHFLQNIESYCTTQDGRESEANQKQSLRARLEELVEKYHPQLIAEEAKLDADCLGKQIAKSHGLKYCNLTMSWEERAKVGVGRDYDRKDETRQAAYSVFEEFMFEQVEKNRGGAEAILVVCGSYHVCGLAKSFRTAGHEVVSEDTYYAEWYRGRPLESDGKVEGFYKETYGRL